MRTKAHLLRKDAPRHRPLLPSFCFFRSSDFCYPRGLMTGVLYLSLAAGCWTVWAVLSARLGGRISPLNTLLWTGLVSAIITCGGFLVHHQQLRLPSRNEWWLIAIFCAANTAACFGYYAALRHLPGCLVLPLSHLYLVLGPVLLAFMERRNLSWQQVAALCVVVAGVVLFMVASPESVACQSGETTVQTQTVGAALSVPLPRPAD